MWPSGGPSARFSCRHNEIRSPNNGSSTASTIVGRSARSLGVGPVWFGGPDLGEKPDPDDRVSILGRGAIILRQFVTWSDPQPFRDPPNTSVRGRPAVLTQLTAAANNIDLVEFQWQGNPTGRLPQPL